MRACVKKRQRVKEKKGRMIEGKRQRHKHNTTQHTLRERIEAMNLYAHSCLSVDTTSAAATSAQLHKMVFYISQQNNTRSHIHSFFQLYMHHVYVCCWHCCCCRCCCCCLGFYVVHGAHLPMDFEMCVFLVSFFFIRIGVFIHWNHLNKYKACTDQTLFTV